MSYPINNGIADSDRKAIASGLSKVLADTYVLYLKTQYFHWNVTGPMFDTLHRMFELHYKELALAVDEVAERIRSLGQFAPGNLSDYAKLTSIREIPGIPHAHDMIRYAVEGHESVAKTARDIFEIAENAKDQATVDLLTRRLEVHEKTAWMLRSLIEG